MRNPEDYKDTYELWIEFLKESEGYKQYCREHRKSKQLKADEIYQNGKAAVYDYDFGGQALNPSEPDFSKVFRIFGNIHAPDYKFDLWWDTTAKRLFKWYQDDCDAVYKVQHDEWAIDNTDIDELSETPTAVIGMLEDWLGEDQGCISLKINTFYPIDDLVNQFVTVIEHHKDRWGITPEVENDFISNLFPVIVTNRLASELKEYLEVYRLRKQTVKWKEIIRPRVPNAIKTETTLKGRKIESIDRNIFRKYQYYVTKADAIIRNTEMNKFPGEY
jgi:hypothetical protein